MDDTIVTIRFTDPDEARRALQRLKQLDLDKELRVREAALVERSGQGGVGVPDDARDTDGFFMPQGGIVGMTVDALVGPLGMAFRRPTNGFRGHGARPADQGEREVALEQISRELEPGVTLVIAEIAAADPDVVGAALEALGGTVTNRAAADVYAEVRAAKRAAELTSVFRHMGKNNFP
jgi:uncharacterized membrane protein